MASSFRDLRARLRGFNESVRVLQEAEKLEENLFEESRQSVSKAKEGRVLEKLASIPLEQMRVASERPVRAETLRKYGVSNVAGVYLSSTSQLARISGISPEGASELKKIASEMYLALEKSLLYGVDIDNVDGQDLQVLESVQQLDGVRRRLGGRTDELRSLIESMKEPLHAASPLKSRWGWLFAGSEKRRRAVSAVGQLSEIVLGTEFGAVLPLAKAALDYAQERPSTPAALEDFKKRAGDYYAVLETVTGARPQLGQRHFSSELVAQIEGQVLDQSLINATMRRYQSFGTRFALSQRRVIIGDEMGLGKTLQALAVLTQRTTEGATKFLIVCPASVLINWEREITSRTSLRAFRVHGVDQHSNLKPWVERGGIALTTFDTLKSFEFNDEEIASLGVDTVVVDEAHYIKNLETGRTKTMMRWLARIPHAVFLTGTPLENRVEEFINLASLLDRDFAGRLNHAALAAGAESFRHHVAPMYLRRNTEEVLQELPERIEVLEYCTWDGSNYDSYLGAVASGNFMAMRRAGMLPAGSGSLPNKLERLLEITNEAFESGKKVLIFSYFKDVLTLVADALGASAVGPITGAVSAKQRQELVDLFTLSEEPLALVGQIQAAGTGLNIQAASVVIICEPQIKPSLEVQAIARAHRMGQVSVVQVHRLLIPDGIDELMMDLLARKQAEFDAYARESELANSVESAKDKTDESLAAKIVAAERERLGIEATSEGLEVGPLESENEL